MAPHVSVIVPVFDPGETIDECIASLLGQTMPAGRLELIFVDDGSTDGTAERLDALAAAHAHVRVEHIPNSGWPGRPRNIGMDMARGEFVYFVDNDDWLEPDAVERLHAAAVEDAADIVVGKVVGHGKKVPRELFRESVRGSAFTPRLLALLTPHKLFRRATLEAHDIRFPEGRRRLEDHLFVVHAYFHARAVSVLADRPYYHWVLRDRARNASYRPIEPEGYFANVREVLDLVEAHTEPGPFRDALLAHWYRGKMLGRLTGGFARRDAAPAERLLATLRALALERYDEGVDERLAYNLRVRSALLRRGEAEPLRALARFEGAARARLRARVRFEGDELALRLTASLGGPEFARDGERVAWVPPAELREALAGADLDATEALRSSSVQVYLHSLRDGSEYLLPATTALDLGADPGVARPVLRTRVRTSFATAAGGAPLTAGEWELRAVVTVAGFSHARSVRRNGAPVVLTASGRGAAAGWTAAGRTSQLLRRIRARRGLRSLLPVAGATAR